MARFLGIELPNEKKVGIAVTYIYGIGDALAAKVLKESGVNIDQRVKDVTEDEWNKIRQVVEANKIVTEGELRRVVAQNIRRLKDIGSYRGWRHKKNLPVRGQRTRTNARTRRGKKITVGGSSGKKALQKT